MLTGFPAGLITTLICFAGAAAIIVCNRFIKKVTNCYFFWLAIAIGILAYFISCRFAISWKNFGDWLASGKNPPGSEYSGAQIISRALLFDFCPFFGFLTPILLIVDPSRKAARSVAPILLLGTIFTCTAGFLTEPRMSMDPYWFFHGTEGWELYVGLHLVNMWLAVSILCNTPKFEFEGYLIMLGCVFLYIVYILVAKTITGCELATSGLSYRDWVMNYEAGVEHPGTYYPITKLLGGNPKVAMGLTWPTELAAFSGIVALWDRGFKKFKWHAFANAKNNKIVTLPTGQKTKQWWFWYDSNKFVEPHRIPWAPLKKVSIFWSKPAKFEKRSHA
ncbi:MAG: DUF5378 family protein [Mycoplasmoidaceae bacterium]